MSRVRVKIDRLKEVVRNINELVRKDVLVGVPGETADRDQEEYGPMNNPTLAYIHDNGSPAANIPARPFMQPGIEAEQDRIAAHLRKAAAATLDGLNQKANDELEAAGMVASSSVKNQITSGDFAPLSEATLRARAARGRKGAKAELESRAAGNAPNNDNARPLIDTGQLRQSITYVVRGKK
ncbi:MAG TPA: hypothetical protein VIK69_04220 [Methylophilaceae bacterium]